MSIVANAPVARSYGLARNAAANELGVTLSSKILKSTQASTPTGSAPSTTPATPATATTTSSGIFADLPSSVPSQFGTTKVFCSGRKSTANQMPISSVGYEGATTPGKISVRTSAAPVTPTSRARSPVLTGRISKASSSTSYAERHAPVTPTPRARPPVLMNTSKSSSCSRKERRETVRKIHRAISGRRPNYDYREFPVLKKSKMLRDMLTDRDLGVWREGEQRFNFPDILWDQAWKEKESFIGTQDVSVFDEDELANAISSMEAYEALVSDDEVGDMEEDEYETEDEEEDESGDEMEYEDDYENEVDAASDDEHADFSDQDFVDENTSDSFSEDEDEMEASLNPMHSRYQYRSSPDLISEAIDSEEDKTEASVIEEDSAAQFATYLNDMDADVLQEMADAALNIEDEKICFSRDVVDFNFDSIDEGAIAINLDWILETGEDELEAWMDPMFSPET